ncbi:MAG: DEAD/DEAH box helicase family protein, partial [Paraclostridium sp.]
INSANKVVLECSRDIANDVINSVYSKAQFDMTANGDSLMLSTDIKNIDILNKELLLFKNVLKFDKSFIRWRSAHKGKSPVIIRAGVINSKIYKGGYDLPHKDIEDVCKYFFEPAVRQKRFKEKKWDGFIHLYKKWVHEFPTGLLDKVCDVLKSKDIPFKVEYAYDVEVPRQFDWKAKHLFEPTDDQKDALEACLNGKRGVCKAVTGFGKTSMLARYLTASHGVPTLFIANKKVLVEDAAKDFIAGIEGITSDDVVSIKDGMFCGMKITASTIREDVGNISQPIIVATIQSLSARLKDERTKGSLLYWLRNVCKFVMVV